MSDLHVVLVAPEIHWNTGNAGRTCLAAGATLHLVKPLGFSLDAKEVRRAGLDYWERVPLRVWESLDELEPSLPGLGEPFFVSPDADRTLWDVSFPDRVALVFGCETSGLPARDPRQTPRPPHLRSDAGRRDPVVESFDYRRDRRLRGASPAGAPGARPASGERLGRRPRRRSARASTEDVCGIMSIGCAESTSNPSR